MLKMVVFLKRKPSMSLQAFKDRYESRTHGHALLGERYVPEACRYVRRYLQPMPDLVTGKTDEPTHDVITELWFENQQKFDAAMARLGQPDVAAIIAADEDEIFDRTQNRVFMVEECDSEKG